MYAHKHTTYIVYVYKCCVRACVRACVCVRVCVCVCLYNICIENG